jgi:hypothetical protein
VLPTAKQTGVVGHVIALNPVYSVVNSGNQPEPPFLVARIALLDTAKQVDTLGQLMLSKFAKLPDGATTCQRVAPPSVVAMIQPVE